MLQKLRKFSESKVAQLFLALILMSFVLWGMGDLYKSVTAKYVAKVGNVKISAPQFEYMLKEEMSRVRQQAGPEIANMMRESIKANLIENRINRILLTREVADSGFAVSDQAVADHIRSIPAFQGADGKFDRAKYQSFMQNSGKSEAALVSELKTDMALEQLTGLLFDVAEVPASMVKAHYLAQNETRKITLYTIGKASVQQSYQPSEKEIQEYYEANKRRFMKPETRGGEYAVISTKVVKDEAKVSDEEVKSEFENNIDLYGTPERRTLSQILCENKEDAAAAEAALKGGMNFDEAQAKFCKKLKMNLPDVTANDLPEGVSKQAFALKESETSAIIESPLGFHIFKAVKVTPAKEATLEEVKEKIRGELAERKKEDGLYQILGKIEDMAIARASLKEIADKYGLEVKKFAPLAAEGKAPEELLKLKDFMKVLYSTEPNSVSQVKESTAGEYYLLSPTQVTPAAARPLDEVKTQVIDEIKKQKQLEVLKATATEIAKAENIKEQAAKLKAALSEKIVTIGRDGKYGEASVPQGLASETFMLAKGAVTGTFQTHDGDYEFARVEDVVPAAFDAKSEKAKELEKILQKQMQDDMFGLFAESLRKKYGAEINYDVLDSIAAGDTK